MRFCQELSAWWPLFSPPVHYVEELDDLLRRPAPLPPPWLRLFEAAGLSAESDLDEWGRGVFVARKA